MNEDSLSWLQIVAVVGPIASAVLTLVISRLFESRDRAKERAQREIDHQRELERIRDAELRRRESERLGLVFEQLEPLLQTIDEISWAAHRVVLLSAAATSCAIDWEAFSGTDHTFDADEVHRYILERALTYGEDEVAERERQRHAAEKDRPRETRSQRFARLYGSRVGVHGGYEVPYPRPDNFAEADAMMVNMAVDPDPEGWFEEARPHLELLASVETRTDPIRRRCRVFGLDDLEAAIERVLGATRTLSMFGRAAIEDSSPFSTKGNLALFDGTILPSKKQLDEAARDVAVEARKVLVGDVSGH